MSILLFIVGAIAFVAGIAMAGFGIPVGEFSFGNTLITSGTTMAVGGLILIGLAAVVSQLKHLAEVMVAPFPVRAGRPSEPLEPAAAAPAPSPARTAATPGGGRMSFPSRPKPEPALREPEAAEPVQTRAAMAPEDRPSFTPSLRNPDVPPVSLEDEVSLSPHEAVTPASRDPDQPTRPEPSPTEEEENVDVSAMRRGPIRETGWRPGPPPVTPVPGRRSTYFDSMWPADGRPSRGPAASDPTADASPEVSPEVKPEPAPEVAAEPGPDMPPVAAEPEVPGELAGEEPQRAVAVLKSGVVDGMGYTLYVDGSIEAELPQGTLRFASINELRAHLEKNS